MKSPAILISAILGSLLFSAEARAESPALSTSVDVGYTERTLGVGLILGDPTAIAFKLRFDDAHALQLGVGWGWLDPYSDRFTLMLDYLYHASVLSDSVESTGLLQLYVGLGGKVGFHEGPNATTFGGRVPLGVAFQLRDVPIELFVEVAPGVLFVPGLYATVDGGLGARFYF